MKGATGGVSPPPSWAGGSASGAEPPPPWPSTCPATAGVSSASIHQGGKGIDETDRQSKDEAALALSSTGDPCKLYVSSHLAAAAMRPPPEAQAEGACVAGPSCALAAQLPPSLAPVPPPTPRLARPAAGCLLVTLLHLLPAVEYLVEGVSWGVQDVAAVEVVGGAELHPAHPAPSQRP